MSVNDKRFELSKFTSIDLDSIDDTLICLLYELYHAAIDPSMPQWFRVTVESWFSQAEFGLSAMLDKALELKAQLSRKAEFEGDMVGRESDWME